MNPVNEAAADYSAGSNAPKKKKILSEEVVKLAVLDMVEELKETLLAKPGLLNLQDIDTNTLFIHSAIEGNVDTFKLLLELNCEINTKGKHGNTALLNCVSIGYSPHEQMLSILLGCQNIDVNVCNDFQETAFTVACKFSRFKMASDILNKGADMNHQGINKNTMLMTSCFEGNRVVFDYLMGLKSDIFLKNINGSSAFFIACNFSHLDLAKALLDNGYDINSRDNNKRTALIISIMTNKENVTNFLIENGADVNVQDEWGYSALMFASKYKENFPQAFKLIKSGAKINLVDRNRDSALHFACRKNNTEMINFLIDSNADPKTENFDYENPIDCIEDIILRNEIITKLSKLGYDFPIPGAIPTEDRIVPPSISIDHAAAAE